MGKLDYLKQYRSTNTVSSYESALKNFFRMVYKIPRKEPKEKKKDQINLEELAERYFSEKRNYEEDMQNFLIEIKDFAPKTVKLHLSAVRIFLLENKVELSQQFWRRLQGRVKGSRALTLDKVPSNVELRKIMTHLPVQGKTLFLVLSSSGMRIGEALKLVPEDLEFNDPAQINIRGEYTKTGNSRVTFISKEASEAVGEWLKIRKEYLGSAAARSRYEKSIDDSRLFPFTEVNARHMWNIALRKTGNGKMDAQTNIHLVHPHVLRKFFRSKMATVIPVDVTEALMGHEGYLTEVYRKYSTEDLAGFYKQGEHTLLIFTEVAEISKIKAEVEDRNKQLQTLVNGMATENMDLKQRMMKLEQKIAGIEKDVHDVREKISQ
jgi:integrase